MSEIPANAPLDGAPVYLFDNPDRLVESRQADAAGMRGDGLVPATTYAHMPHEPLGPCYAPPAATKDGAACKARAVKGTRLCYGHWRSAIAFADAVAESEGADDAE